METHASDERHAEAPASRQHSGPYCDGHNGRQAGQLGAQPRVVSLQRVGRRACAAQCILTQLAKDAHGTLIELQTCTAARQEQRLMQCGCIA